MGASTELRPAEIHRTAFRLWTQGFSFSEIARRLKASPGTVSWWCRREGWETLARDLAPLLRDKLLEQEATTLEAAKLQHLREAKSLRLRALEMLDGYVTQVVQEPPVKGKRSKPTVIIRHLRPHELLTVTDVWTKAMEVETRLLGGEAVTPMTGDFPAYHRLLEEIWATRKTIPIEATELDRKALPAEVPVNGRRRKAS